MKHNFIMLSVALLCVTAISCTKEKDNTELAPSITKIIDALGTEVSQASLGSTVTIVGQNLSDASKVVVDGADVSGSITKTRENINVTLPDELPEVMTGKIVVTTPYGEAEAPFSIFAMLVVEKMKCEYVLPGTDLTIIGRYFAANGFSVSGGTGEVLIGGKKATIKKVEAEELTVTVPADAEDNSSVVLKSATTGDEGIKVPGLYRDNEYMIIDLELGKGAGYYLVDKGVYPNDPAVSADIAPIQGNAYIHYHHWTGPKYGERTAIYNGGYYWDKLTSGGWMNNTTISSEILSNPQDYAFKFEVKTNIPNKLRFNLYWKNATAGAFGVYWPDYDKPADQRRDYNAEGLSDDAKKQIILEDYSATFDTKGEWVTVSIPFTQFMKHTDSEGKEVAGFSIEDAGKTLSHEMPVHTEYIQTENDIYFDCFRISKVK